MDRTITDNEKQSLLNQMKVELSHSEFNFPTETYQQAYDALKLLDTKLDFRGYTEVHPSRYQIVKLLEKAKQYV